MRPHAKGTKHAAAYSASVFCFDLAASEGDLCLSSDDFKKIKFDLLESQPATSVRLVGDPPTAIRVKGPGPLAKVAPAVYGRACELAGQPLVYRPLREVRVLRFSRIYRR